MFLTQRARWWLIMLTMATLMTYPFLSPPAMLTVPDAESDSATRFAFASESPAIQSIELSGVWSHTQDSLCWVLTEQNSSRSFSILPLPGIDLHPEESGDSTYLGYHDGQPGWCTGTTFVVTAVIYESTTIPTPATQNQPTLNPVAEDTLWNSMPSLNTLLLALLLVGMAGAGIGTARNEAIRFPLHQAMGAFTQTLRGNNRRSVEAAFQRGRIVGFLVPNQGCHLSALVRSLNMGNNQAAHHLKILEDEGLIWRRKDGRHLRFYTVDILRTAKGAQLPTPPLNLDTAGLPYRLLRLISAIKNEGGRARTPNQRQLATALGTSQQLISHHLMTLETNGLILRSRDGIRTRLSLTPAGDAAAAQVNDSS